MTVAEREGWRAHQGAPTPHVLVSQRSIPGRQWGSHPPGSLAGLPEVQQAGLGDPTHPSKEYLLVLGMSVMSMKPRFPAGGGWGMEGRAPPCWGRGPGAGPGPGEAWASAPVPRQPLLSSSPPHPSQPSLTCRASHYGFELSLVSGEKQREELVRQAGAGLASRGPPCLHICPGSRAGQPISEQGARGHSHGPVVPVHEDKEHGSQEKENGQDNDRHLGRQGQA